MADQIGDGHPDHRPSVSGEKSRQEFKQASISQISRISQCRLTRRQRQRDKIDGESEQQDKIAILLKHPFYPIQHVHDPVSFSGPWRCLRHSSFMLSVYTEIFQSKRDRGRGGAPTLVRHCPGGHAKKGQAGKDSRFGLLSRLFRQAGLIRTGR